MTSRVVTSVVAVALALGLSGCAGFDDPGPVSWNSTGANPRVLRNQPKLQCVPYARQESGVGIWGDAYLWWDKAAGRFGRASAPEAGSVMVMKGYGNAQRGHVAVVRRVVNDREIVVDHANWLNGGEISLDNPVMDVSDDNDWSEVRVWYAPGGHYGGRVYAVQGFILSPSEGQRVASR
ncbi:MAG: CHAP domain-containing protein [Micropepsaceae bacterium]